MRLLPILFTVFIDSLGFGLVMPLLGPFLLEASSSTDQIFSSSLGWLYSFLVASYCMGQFFGSPILGAVSDRLGRKKILTCTVVLAFLSYALGFFSVSIFSVLGLLLSRVLAGVAAGNYAIAQSYVADETDAKNKAKSFGLLGMSWGVGFIVGPYVGGRCIGLSCFSSPWAGPFFLAGLLCLVNFLLVIFFLKDSSFVPKKREISLTTGFRDVKKAFSHPKLRVLFKVMFIFCFGWGFFTEFCPLFLMKKLEFSVEGIANFFAFVGLWVALCQGLLIRPLLKKFSSQILLASALLIFSLLLVITSFVKTSFQLFAILPFLAFFESIIYPSAASMISNLTSKENQGEVLGIYNSVQWAAIGITPFFSGSLVVKYPFLPPVIASISMFLGFSVFVWFWAKCKGDFLTESSS